MLSALKVLGLLIAMSVASSSMAQVVPSKAQQYRQTLVRIAHSEWGLDAPIPTFAAQLQQESGWNSLAVSRVGAQGMAQFMPATAEWLCNLNKTPKADCVPTNPVWAIRSLVQYDRWLYDRISALNHCHRMAFTLSAYNGGLGWVYRDQKRASSLGLDSHQYFGGVDAINAGRSAANFKENRDYPIRILMKLEPVYATWGSSSCEVAR